MYRWYLALRWLLSRPINLLGMAGVTVSVWALIVVVSIFSGFLVEVRKHVRAVTSDLTVLNVPPSLPYAQLDAVLRSDPNVAATAPRLSWYGLLHPLGKRQEIAPRVRTLDAPAGDVPLVSLVGIVPTLEREVTGFGQWVDAVTDPALRVPDAAQPLDRPPGDKPAILVSERRLRGEFVGPGAVAKVTSARLGERDDRDGGMQKLAAEFTIAGCYTTRHTAFDDLTCFVPIETLRRVMQLPAATSVSEVVVRCRDGGRATATAARLERRLNAERGGLEPVILVRTWDQLHAQFLAAVEHQRSLMKLVLIVIMVVAAFLMFATLSMMVTEKTHDIGILSAMGAARSGILRVFLFCGLSITAVGTGLGIVAGCLSSVYLDSFNRWLRATFDVDLFPPRIYHLDRVPYDLDPAWIAQVAAMALILGLVVSGLPAWRAARHDPVESLRHE
ncbi:MAG: FtsX-like permease family protein [Planctomycetota bacterium]